MKLRAKLAVAQLPLVLALAVTAAAALYGAARFGAAPGEILYENFRSFDAAHGMSRALDAIDREMVAATLSGEPLARQQIAEAVSRFERELSVAENNITETGEAEALERLRAAWETYRDDLDGVGRDKLAAHRAPAAELHDAVDAIVGINRDAMGEKSETARSEAARIGTALAVTAVVAFVLAILIAGARVRRILAPIRVLERAVPRVAEGDFDAKIRIAGDDEVASLSESFNAMAARLVEYRESSLGELLEANSRLESVMDSLADAVVVYGVDGVPTANNRMASGLLGEHTGIDRMPDDLQTAARAAFDQVRQTAEPHEPTSLEAAVEVPTNPPRWILASATPVIDARGLSGVTVAFRDVTRSRRLEGFKGDLVSAAAHELRTPLTSLHMAVHLCLEEAAGPISDRQRDLLAAARQDCERLQLVVEELLEMARLESGAARLAQMKLIVSEQVREAVGRNQSTARRRGCELAMIPGDSLLAVRADPARLGHVLDNLIANAMIHAGGGRIEVAFEEAGDSIRVTVDDAGHGVPEHLRDRVFSKFFRVPGTAKRGSGLGLSIVADIVRAHNGAVGVETSALGGARFWFTIPTPQPPAS
jgi:signal transduction histidine kinase